MRRRRLAATVASILAATVALTACAPELDPSWQPARWEVVGELRDAAPATIDPSTIALTPQRLRNDDVRIDARWADLPVAGGVNDAVANIVRAAVASQSTAVGVPYRPQVHAAGAGLGDRGCVQGSTTESAADLLGSAVDPHAVVVCDIVRASGSVLGQRIRVVQGAAAGATSDTTTIVYGDAASGAAGTARELFADPMPVWNAVVEILRQDAGSLVATTPLPPTEAESQAFAAALDTTLVDDGAFVMQLPAGFVPDQLQALGAVPVSTADAPMFVSLPVSTVAAALSPLGQVVAAATGPAALPVAAGPGFERTDCDLVPCMALTLDDGPSGYTPGVLDVLRDQHSAATFFMLGQNAQGYPDTVRRVAAEGHQIGNHTWNHPYLTKLDDAQIRSQLDRTSQVLRDLSGQPVATFRPPGGFIDGRVVAIAGEPAIMWSIDTRDWAGPDDQTLLRYAIDAPQRGSIMLMHDIQAVTSRVFPQVVAGLRDRGFSLVTVDTLFGGSVPPGIVRQAS